MLVPGAHDTYSLFAVTIVRDASSAVTEPASKLISSSTLFCPQKDVHSPIAENKNWLADTGDVGVTPGVVTSKLVPCTRPVVTPRVLGDTPLTTAGT